MNTQRGHGGYLIALTLLVTLILSILPLPIIVKAYRPDWTLLVLMYWVLALPHKVNVGVAWLCGFLLDILFGTVLGVHALSCAIVIYIMGSNYQRIRNFSIWQQAIVVGVLLALYHLLVFWLSYFLSSTLFLPEYLYPVSIGIVLWHGIFYLLRRYRRRFNIR